MKYVPNIIPYSALYIDMTKDALTKIIPAFVKTPNREGVIQGITEIFTKKGKNEHLLPTLSVRSAFDLYLEIMDFPLGSEIIMTCVNIPDMVRVLRYHGMIPIPLEVDVEKLGITREALEKAITPKTKCIMISYIFNARWNADFVFDVAAKHGIPVLEDCAETFYDLAYNGDSRATMSCFSFGSIKINTAFGAALNIIRDKKLYDKMKAMHDTYEILPSSFYAKKIFKTILPMLALNYIPINLAGKHSCNALGIEYKEKAIAMLRGFPHTGDFLQKFRSQPPTVMLAMLLYRLKTFDVEEFKKMTAKQVEGQDILTRGGVTVPGFKTDIRNFWLYPIVVPDVQLCYKMLNDRGVDAYLGATQLDIVEPPIGSKYTYPTETLKYFDKLLYLPIHKNVPAEVIRKIAKEVVEVVSIVNMIQGKQKGPLPAPGGKPKL